MVFARACPSDRCLENWAQASLLGRDYRKAMVNRRAYFASLWICSHAEKVSGAERCLLPIAGLTKWHGGKVIIIHIVSLCFVMQMPNSGLLG